MSIQSVNSAALSSIVTPRQGSGDAPDVQAARSAAVASAPAQPQKASAEVSRQQLDEAVKAISDLVKTANSSLQFTVDEDTGKTVVKVIDQGTKEVVKQIPSEEMLAIAKAIDGIKGLLVHQKA